MIWDILTFSLLGNTITECLAGSVLLLKPELLSKGNVQLWIGNGAVKAFGTRICGCALLALSMSSLLTLFSRRRVNKPVLFSLGFYHSSVLIAGLPMLGFNKEELQIPAGVIHSSLAAFLLYCGFVGDEEASD
jgi:hypothetical protein